MESLVWEVRVSFHRESEGCDALGNFKESKLIHSQSTGPDSLEPYYMRNKLWEERPKLTSRHAKDFPDDILQQDRPVRGDLGFANNFPISSFISVCF